MAPSDLATDLSLARFRGVVAEQEVHVQSGDWRPLHGGRRVPDQDGFKTTFVEDPGQQGQHRSGVHPQASAGGCSLCGGGAGSMTWRTGSNAITLPLR